MYTKLITNSIKYVGMSGILIALLGSLMSAQAKEITIERSYSKTIVQVPKECEQASLRPICTRLVNYYTRRFEREMVLRSNQDISAENDLNLTFKYKRQKAIQNIDITVYSKKESAIFTLFSIFQQNLPNGVENMVVETVNFESATSKPIKFNDLFDNPALAAMLCARAIENNYQQYKSPNLQIAVSVTELSPSNFAVFQKGLRFFFAPGIVKSEQTDQQTDTIFIPIESLIEAGPKAMWWPNLDRSLIPVTATQEQLDQKPSLNKDQADTFRQLRRSYRTESKPTTEE